MGAKSKSAANAEDTVKWIPNATYGEKAPKRNSRKIDRIIDMLVGTCVRDEDDNVLAPGQTVCIQGLHGISKTTATIASLEERDIEAVAFSASVLLPPDWYGMIPRVVAAQEAGATDEELMSNPDTRSELDRVGRAMATQATYVLETHLSKRLVHEKPWVLIIDEANRVQKTMLAAFMEVTVDGSVLGRVLDQLVGVVLLRNPAGDGYMGIAAGDLAFESRFPTFTVTEKDFAWQEYLAQKYPEVNLKGFFDRRNALDATARRVFCPRVVEHVLDVTIAGLPGEIALPILPSGRQKILNQDGSDVTEQVLRMTAEEVGVPYRAASTFPNLVDTCRKLSLEKGWNLREVGPHGIGKTTTAKLFGKEMGLPTSVLSASMADPSSFVQLVPMDGVMQPILADRVNFDEPGLLVLDEFTLADKTVKPQMLEVTGPTRSIGSLPINAKAVWALDNPARHGAIQYSGRSADEAMVSRFVLNLEVTEDDYQWREALTGKFGDRFSHFAEWRSQDLNPDEKNFVQPRTLGIMANLDKYGLDIDEALPFLGKDRVPLRTHLLKARLADRKVLGLGAIIEQSGNLLSILTDPSADEAEKTEVAAASVRAFQKADLVDLEPHADVLVDFIKALPPHSRTSIINAAQAEKGEKGQKKVLFWSEIFGRTLA